jgi:predicted nucleotidyltransferase
LEPLRELLAAVEDDPDSLGLLLHGSRATGASRADSDYDLIRVVTDEACDRRGADRTRLERSDVNGSKIDVLYQSPARLRQLAENPSWPTATYLAITILADKTGEVAELVRDIGERAGDRAHERVSELYDAYLNSFVRSLKAWRRGDELGGRLHAADSARHLAELLFAAERRWPPYLDQLEPALPELERAQDWPTGFLRGAFLELVTSGAPSFQQELELRVEALMTSRGIHHEWGDDLEPLKMLDFG